MPAFDEKDRYGEKLAQVEKAREDQWAAARDRELLAKLRKEASEPETVVQGRPAPVSNLFTRIPWPTDFDENSLVALELAGKLCLQNAATLYLVHVCPSLFVPLGGPVTEAIKDEEVAREKLRSIAAHRLAGIQHEIVIATGDPADRIVEIARSLEADLAVMATHGRRGLPRLLLGSVAEHVVREAPCPVLTTPER